MGYTIVTSDLVGQEGAYNTIVPPKQAEFVVGQKVRLAFIDHNGLNGRELWPEKADQGKEITIVACIGWWTNDTMNPDGSIDWGDLDTTTFMFLASIEDRVIEVADYELE